MNWHPLTQRALPIVQWYSSEPHAGLSRFTIIGSLAPNLRGSCCSPLHHLPVFEDKASLLCLAPRITASKPINTKPPTTIAATIFLTLATLLTFILDLFVQSLPQTYSNHKRCGDIARVSDVGMD